MKISVVIPNYNGEKLLCENLPFVISSVEGAEIIIVDDASTDKSIEILQKKFPQVKIVQKATNEGFASTVNKGISEASGELIVLLNTDVVPHKDFLKFALPHFKNKDVFAVGFSQKCIEDGKLMYRGRGVGAFQKGFLVHNRGEVDAPDTLWVSAGAGIFRKSIWDRLGGLCELYNPFYWEDIDISYRAQKAGYKTVFEPKSLVDHKQVTGSIRSKYTPDQVKEIAYRNQLFFVWLNISDRRYVLEHFLFLPVFLIRAFLHGDFSFLKGLAHASVKLNQIISVRKRNKRFWNIRDKDLI
jgi:GT2 family glycosyltransferase